MTREKPTAAPRLAQEFDSLAAFLEYKLGERKARAAGLTLRQFARACGFKSPAMVSMMVNGTRLPSVGTVEIMARVLKISDDELSYLRHLLAFERAESDEEREIYRGKLAYARASMTVRSYAEDSLLGAGHWYFPVLIELVGQRDFKEDPVEISARLRDRVDPATVQAALAFLLEKGVFERDEQGHLVRGSRDLEWPGGSGSAAVRKYHCEMLGLAADSLDLPVGDRFVSGLTLTLDAAGYEILTSEVTRFLRELMLRADVPTGDSVFQLQVQMFPLTRKVP
jgi:uncharacterized protein (TIGR02147 family)